MISNLDVNTVYTIEVSANNSIGEGNVIKGNDTTKMRGENIYKCVKHLCILKLHSNAVHPLTYVNVYVQYVHWRKVLYSQLRI